MTTDADILTLAQWVSPAFPVGAFAYSHGLETAIRTGAIATSKDLFLWLKDVLEHGSGQADCVVLHAAYRCETLPEVADVDADARAFAGSSERLRETTLQGAAFTKTANAIWRTETPEFVLPAAIGFAAKLRGIDPVLTAAMYAQAFASNLVSAAVRLVPLGQTEGQSTLAALTPICQQIATTTRNSATADLQSTAFLSDIAAMTHETLNHRIFRS